MDTMSKNFELAIKLRHELHEHPELSNNEVWTKKHLIDFIKKHTKLKIVDKGFWFYAVYKSEIGKRNLAFRADFDAIPMQEPNILPYASKNPGAAHKCGHDGHSASLALFALEVDENGSDNNIFFLFQHAEETGDGAKEAKEFIKENNIDEIFAFHNMSGLAYKSINVIDGIAQCASKGMTIHLEGKPSHASEPEKGINPSFAIADIIHAIPDLISPENNKGMVLCTIIQIAVGERAFGVNAGKGDLLLTIRAYYEEELDKLQKNLEDLAASEALKYGLKVSFYYNDCFPETYNHKESSDKIRKVAKVKGYEVKELNKAYRGSEDFGHYTKETKGAIFYIGNGENYPPLHTNQFDFKDELMETAVHIYKGLAEIY